MPQLDILEPIHILDGPDPRWTSRMHPRAGLATPLSQERLARRAEILRPDPRNTGVHLVFLVDLRHAHQAMRERGARVDAELPGGGVVAQDADAGVAAGLPAPQRVVALFRLEARHRPVADGAVPLFPRVFLPAELGAERILDAVPQVHLAPALSPRHVLVELRAPPVIVARSPLRLRR